jgi:tRNA dimethylallyltransferase
VTSQTCIEQEQIERIFAGIAIEAQKQIPIRLNRKKRKVIVLAGPTGCGKTAFGIELAKKMQGEIVSADSMQIYRTMDIGTSKPTSEQRALIPHHMLDIRDVSDSFNVVDFYYEARKCCQTIHETENNPIVVGGSGFYIHSFLYGPPSGPPSVPELRKLLENELAVLGSEALFERLKQLDPHYASTITKHDKQKIVRGLEIIRLTGKKVSKHHWKTLLKPLNYDFRCWFLHRPKEVLYRRIEDRCEKMLEEGFLEEVQRLINVGIKENSSASQAIGYRQALDFFDSKQTPGDYQKFLIAFKQASRNYAKRQFTWFRKEREPLFRWLDLEMHDQEIAIDMILQDFEAL